LERWERCLADTVAIDSSISTAPHRSIADRNLREDRSDELIRFYHAEEPLKLEVGGELVSLPFTCALASQGSGTASLQQVELLISDKPYRLPAFLSDHYAAIQAEAELAGHFNGDVARVESLKGCGDKTTIALGKAKYFETLATNYAMDRRLGQPCRSLRELVHTDGRLLPFSAHDTLVNSIGVVVMVESSDGFLVAQQRSGAVINRANTLSSSVSGAVKWRQLGEAHVGARLPFSILAAVAQEHVREELAIDLPEICFLGIFRELLRGGKPETYWYGKSALKFEELRQHLSRAEHRSETKSLTALDFRNRRHPRVGLSDKQAFELRLSGSFHSIVETGNMTLIAGVLLSAAHIRALHA
jgi:hypothetical protein